MGEKSEQKREYILKRAKEVFAKKGFRDVTMKDIVEACEISRGGLYLYFGSTEEIFKEILMSELESEEDDVTSYLTEDSTMADILMLFLNCGIRRSELVGLNMNDVYEDRIRVVGKGNKERFVYFGSSCRKAIDAYLPERNKIVLSDNRALFGSRDHNRISVSAVHRLVKKALLQAGLDPDQYSAHKLRLTAATMMLSGGVDVKTVQEVLGHENLNTTQIYTHIENTELKIAAEANPLSKLDFSEEK